MKFVINQIKQIFLNWFNLDTFTKYMQLKGSWTRWSTLSSSTSACTSDCICPNVYILYTINPSRQDHCHHWKTANVKPIFKKGYITESKNYRPVSLTCICCKVFEHVVHNQIMNHLDQHNILSNYQHWFRKRWSCDSQLIIILHYLTQAFDKK